MVEELYGIFAEITKRNAVVRVGEFDDELGAEIKIPPVQTPVDFKGGIAFTRPFHIRFGVLLTLNGELVLLRLSTGGKLEDFNDGLTSLNLLYEAFRILNTQLAVIDTESEQRILIVPENSGEITPYFDAVSEMQAGALRRMGPALGDYDEDYQIARPGGALKDKTIKLRVTDGLLQEDEIEAIVIPNERKNVMHVVYPLNVRLDPDEVVMVSVNPPGEPVFIQRFGALRFIKPSAIDERVSKAMREIIWGKKGLKSASE